MRSRKCTSKDLAASRLAAANPSRVGVRLMCNSREREAAKNKNGRETASGQKIISPRCFARARRSNIGARRCLSPRTPAVAPRGYARCKAPELSVRSVISAPPPFRKLHCGGQKQPDSLRKPNLTDTPALGFAACRLRFDPDARKLAIMPLRSSGGESVNHVIALPRRCQERVQTPRQNIVSFAATLSCRNASGTLHNTYCA